MVFGIREKSLKCVFFILILLVGLVFIYPEPSQGGWGTEQMQAASNVPPVIQDFYVNSTWAGNATQFAFSVTDTVALQNCTFTSNETATFTNQSLTLSGTVAWANFTVTLPSYNCYVGFNLWVWNTNASLPPASLGSGNDSRVIKVYSHSYATLYSYVYCNNNYSTTWTNPTYAYNNDTTNGAYTSWNGVDAWSDPLILNLSSSVYSNKIRCFISRNSSYVNEMEIDVSNQTGSWTQLIDETSLTWDTYVNYTSTVTYKFTAIRFTFADSSSSGVRVFVNETQAINIIPNGTAGWDTPFNCLGDAIATVENANNWGSTETYAQVLLDQTPITSLETMIDNYAARPPTNYVYCNSYYSTTWSNPSYAYDNNTATGASYSWSGIGTWSSYLILNLSATVYSNKIQYFVGRNSTYVNEMEIDVSNQTGGWVVFIDTDFPAWNGYTNATSSSCSQFSAMRFSFLDSSASSVRVFVNETQALNSPMPTCDALNTLKWCAFTEKLNMTWANKQNDIIWALGNYTMVGNLPFTRHDDAPSSTSVFSSEDKFALYGYYYAAVYNSTGEVNMTKWNITTAYQQFDTAVNYSVLNFGVHGTKGLPLWIYANNTGQTWTNRYYDEDACTIDCYLIFYWLLNATDALDKAAYWWSYTNQVHWNDAEQHYGYTTTAGYECEASFFLKIISIFKYYNSNLGNWSRVLSDIGNRFLSNEWNSYQWLTNSGLPSTHVVVHMYQANYQTRLGNTIGAWQALTGCYLQLNSTYQNNIKDMLYGTNNTEPAWALLLYPTASLYDNSSHLFKWTSDGSVNNNATAYAEVLMFVMGIVPGTSTIAFPLEELDYEYLKDIDPYLFQLQLNSTLREVRIPVVQGGTITLQYGASPITYNFSTTGVYAVSFSPSWNMITNVTLKSSLPDNLIYFYLPPPSTPAHDVCISSVTFSEENPSVNDTVSIYVTLQNKGGNTEKLSVSVNCTLINETIIGTQNITLEPEQTVTLNFTWTPTPEGLYVVKAYTSEIPGDASPEDNTQTAYLYVGTIPNGGGGGGRMPYMD